MRTKAPATMQAAKTHKSRCGFASFVFPVLALTPLPALTLAKTWAGTRDAATGTTLGGGS